MACTPPKTNVDHPSKPFDKDGSAPFSDSARTDQRRKASGSLPLQPDGPAAVQDSKPFKSLKG